MTTQGTTLAAAAVVGALAGGAVAALVGLSARNHTPVSATIALVGAAGNCVARTLPATVVVRKHDVIQWTVTGGCEGVDVNNVEIQFVGSCQASGSKVAGQVPDLFDESGPHKGRKIRRTIKHGADACFSYRVLHAGTLLEDPELEIIY